MGPLGATALGSHPASKNPPRKASHRTLVEWVLKGTGGTRSYTAAGLGGGVGHGTARSYASPPTLGTESSRRDIASSGAHARVGKESAAIHRVRSVTRGYAESHPL
jgi:hypothetical protein